MKHVFPRLLLAATALTAVLSACGGSDTTTTPAAPKAPVLDNLSATRTAGLLGFAAHRPMPDHPGADPGSIPPPDSPPPRDLSALGLQFENGRAEVCQPKGGNLVCAVVEAQVPAFARVDLWHLPDGGVALTYMRLAGVPGSVDSDRCASRKRSTALRAPCWPTATT